MLNLLSYYDNVMTQIVYILTNPCFSDLIKIGHVDLSVGFASYLLRRQYRPFMLLRLGKYP